jgi:hypothetical protein
MAVADRFGRPQREARLHEHPGRLGVLAAITAAAILAAQLICWVLALMIGPLSAWVWFVVFGVELVPAVFLAGALFIGGEQVSGSRP